LDYIIIPKFIGSWALRPGCAGATPYRIVSEPAEHFFVLGLAADCPNISGISSNSPSLQYTFPRNGPKNSGMRSTIELPRHYVKYNRLYP